MKKINPFSKITKITFKCFILSVALIHSVTSSFAQNYESNFFPIGAYSVRGDFRPVDDFLFNIETAASYHHTSFENLHNQGFNSVYLSYDPIVNTLDTILDIAEVNDMKIIANMNNLFTLIRSNDPSVTNSDIIQAIQNDSIELLKNSPATLGYYLYDEPLQGWIDFDVLENARNILTNMTSDNPHPILSIWNDESQMSYIDSYLNLDVLMMDAYPFEDGDAIGDISQYMPSAFVTDPMPYSDYINTVRGNHCDSQNRPLWAVIQSFGDLETPENGGYWRQVYPKEIRLQVYLSIMQGAKGIWYFLYESEYPYLLGMLDVSGQPTQRLIEVMDINSEINAISETLLKLKVNSDQTGISIDQGKVKLHYDSNTPNLEKYIIAVNTDVITVSNPTITIQKSSLGYEVLSIINIKNNQVVADTETSTEINISVPIEAGDGLILKLSDEALAIDDFDLTKQIAVYPNPVKDELYISRGNISVLSYKLYNILGEIVKSGKVQSNEKIDFKSMYNDIYFLKVNTQYGAKTFKIIKE
jgi:hypothetical protein